MRTFFSLVLNIFKLLQYQRDESTEKHGQRNHGKKIGTKKGTLALQACFKKAQRKVHRNELHRHMGT